MCLENSELGAQVTQCGRALFEGKSPPLDLLGASQGLTGQMAPSLGS